MYNTINVGEKQQYRNPAKRMSMILQ